MSKFKVSAQSWDGSVQTTLYYDGDTLMVRVDTCEGSGSSGYTAFDGSFDDFVRTLKGERVENDANWEICCDGYFPYCSNCGFEPKVHEPLTAFCPNCGKRMVNYNGKGGIKVR